MMLPKRKWVEAEKKKYTSYKGPESDLQKQLNDMFDALNIWNLRFPDGFFRYIKMKAPMGIQRFFFGIFGGIPDSLPMIKVSDKYMLCCPVELKNAKGQLHGKQKHWEHKGIAVQISKSPEQNIDIVERFQADAKIVQGLFQAQDMYEHGKN